MDLVIPRHAATQDVGPCIEGLHITSDGYVAVPGDDNLTHSNFQSSLDYDPEADTEVITDAELDELERYLDEAEILRDDPSLNEAEVKSLEELVSDLEKRLDHLCELRKRYSWRNDEPEPRGLISPHEAIREHLTQ